MSSSPIISGGTDTALKQGRKLLQTDPAAAVDIARSLLASRFRDPAALRLLGAGLRRTGQDEAAAEAENEAILLSTKSSAYRDAERALASAEPRKGIAMIGAFLARDDSDVLALILLGRHRSAERRFKEAEQLLRKAVELAPADATARLALAGHLQRSNQAASALAELDLLSGPDKESVKAMSLRANVLKDLGRTEEEIELLARLLGANLAAEGYRIRLGNAYRTLGRADDAIAVFRDVLSRQPFDGMVWSSLSNIKRVRFSGEDIATMEQGLAIESAHPGNKIRLSFTLGKAYEDRGDYRRSFEFYEQGNNLRASVGRYRPEMLSGWVDDWLAVLTAESVAARARQGDPSPDPIFIVGMQRSGSTLVEQILASHPQVEGTAELPDLGNVAREIAQAAKARDLSIPSELLDLSAEDLAALGAAYIDSTRIYRTQDRPFFTDKLPVNWLNVGIIRLILPNAKIIDVRRSPLDCCFSNWKQLFGKGLAHTYAMDSMGRYYADYVRLMRHIDDVAPGAVHRLIYEDLVDDPEREVRRLLDYLGLPFDEACLNFHANSRSVKTISAEQVRRPINRDGIGQWEHYGEWLGPLKQALGDTLEDWRR